MQWNVAKRGEAQAAQKLDVFISYARADLDRAQEIVKALEARNLKCTIDTRDLPYGEKWQNELRDFIRGADTIVFLVSSASIGSRWCKWELTQVTAQSKRLVPVMLEPVGSAELPPEIKEVHLLPLTPDQPFEARVDALAEALLTDRAWIKEHTRLADRASKWVASARSKDHLLSGNALLEADQWMARRPTSAPAPSQEQLDYIGASHVAAKRRGRRWLGGLGALVVVFAGVAGVALWQRQEAVDQRARAIEERDSALIAQSRLLARASQDALGTGSVSKATLLALEALPGRGPGEERPYVIEAEKALRTSLAAPQEIFRFSTNPGATKPTAGTVAIGDSDVFLAEEGDILHYHVPSRALTRMPMADQSAAIHLSGTGRLFVGTKGGNIVSMGRDAKDLVVFATLSHDISRIETSSDGAYVLVAGQDEWSLLGGKTGQIVKQRAGSGAKITGAGRVVYESNAPEYLMKYGNDRQDREAKAYDEAACTDADNEIRMLDPSSNEDATLFRNPCDDTKIIEFAIDRAGKILVVLSKQEILSFDLSTGKESTVDLPILATSWQSLIVADSGKAALTCAFRSPICVLYEFEDDQGVPLYHPKNADAVSFGASESEFMTSTWDGRLYSWNALSQGAYENVLRQPEFKLEFLGRDLIRARHLADSESFVTVSSEGQEVMVQGWKRRITRLRSAEVKLFGGSIVSKQAEDYNLRLVPKSILGCYLYDLSGDVVTEVPGNDDSASKLCGMPRLMLVASRRGYELWDASQPTVRRLEIPGEVRGLLDEQEPPADLISRERTLAVAAGNKVVLWRMDGGVLESAPFAQEVEELRALEGNGELLVLESDNVHVINARGEVRATARHDIFSRNGVTYTLADACAVGDKGALWMRGRGGSLISRKGDDLIYRFEMAGKTLNFLTETELEPNEVYRAAFNGACTLMAYHSFRSGQAGVYDLDQGKLIAEFALVESEYWGIDFDEKQKGLLLLGASGQIYRVNFDADLARTTDSARQAAVSCLTPAERASLLLAPAPPQWCITGPGLETQDDPARWAPKPPYENGAWKDWLIAARVARDNGAEPPPVPGSPTP